MLQQGSIYISLALYRSAPGLAPGSAHGEVGKRGHAPWRWRARREQKEGGRMGGWEDERIPMVHNEDAIYILSKERERRNGGTGISGETEE